MSPFIAKHELGHAMGFWHTGELRDVMGGGPVSDCDPQPSDRERFHAAIAYSRPRGMSTRTRTWVDCLSNPFKRSSCRDWLGLFESHILNFSVK
jgi:hypothetical protein